MDDFFSTFNSLGLGKHRSWPAFWGCGTAVGILFIGFGIFGTIMQNGSDPGGVITGFFMTLMGIGLLIAVFYTKNLLKDDDLSLQIDLRSDSRKKKYNASRVVRYLENQHNNVAVIQIDNGMVRMFSAQKNFVVEVSIRNGDDYQTFHMLHPEVTEESTVILQNIVLEKIPVPKNRCVNGWMAEVFLQKLYDGMDVNTAMQEFRFIETTQETKRLREKDAFIVPNIPVDFPAKNESSEEWLQRKEDKLQRALKEYEAIRKEKAGKR